MAGFFLFFFQKANKMDSTVSAHQPSQPLFYFCSIPLALPPKSPPPPLHAQPKLPPSHSHSHSLKQSREACILSLLSLSLSKSQKIIVFFTHPRISNLLLFTSRKNGFSIERDRFAREGAGGLRLFSMFVGCLAIFFGLRLVSS